MLCVRGIPTGDIYHDQYREGIPSHKRQTSNADETMDKRKKTIREMKTVKTIFFFPNGMIAVCDNKGEQISELQGSYVTKVISQSKELGYEISDDLEIKMPDGRSAIYIKEHDSYTLTNY